MKKVLITGANGYVGKSLHNHLAEFYDVTAITRNDFSLTDFEAVSSFFKGKYFDVVIHAAVVGGHRSVQDTAEVVAQNIKMYWNIVANRDCFGKFMGFGSGAELGMPESTLGFPHSYYGISKKVVSDLMTHQEGFLNLRLFAVFDHNERPTRFIKSNLQRYINRESMVIHEDMFMDFFYMGDLANLVQHYIGREDWRTEVIDCRYLSSPRLSDIATYINTLSDHKVDINVGTVGNKEYIGVYKGFPTKLIGLEEGIARTFSLLKAN